MSGHPESPVRVKTAYDHLKSSFTFIETEPASKSDLLSVHTSELVAAVQKRDFYDLDSPAYPNIFRYATISAGCAIRAMELHGFSLARPPGHHSGKNFLGGFCYFNNLAIAVRRSGAKTLIVDFDVHHGNGTQDIFLGDPTVEYISLHCSDYFPGSGTHSEQNIFNYPVRYDCNDEEYLKVLENALDLACNKTYEMLAVSAGFDGHVNDPVASLRLSNVAYKRIGLMLHELNLPTFSVLEGGYEPKDLSRNILSYLEGIS